MIWASKTSHQSLNGSDYFGISGNAASFKTENTPDHIASLCPRQGLSHVIDVGSGSDALAKRLRSLDIVVVSGFYLWQIPEATPFDLTLDDAQHISSLNTAIAQQAKGSGHLVICLEVLEHAAGFLQLDELKKITALTADQAADPEASGVSLVNQ